MRGRPQITCVNRGEEMTETLVEKVTITEKLIFQILNMWVIW